MATGRFAARNAFNRDSKIAETNSPMTVTIDLNPADGQNHVTLTDQQWKWVRAHFGLEFRPDRGGMVQAA